MEFLKKIEESIIKSDLKGRFLLYHATTFQNRIQILQKNQLDGYTQQKIKTKGVSDKYKVPDTYNTRYAGVSLTRDQNFRYDVCQFIFDGNLIKQDFGKRLGPLDYYVNDDVRKSDPKRVGDDSMEFESEEFLLGDLTNVSKYILGIRILDYTFDDSETELEEFKNENEDDYKLFLEVTAKYPIYDSNFRIMSLNKLQEKISIPTFEKFKFIK